MRDRASAAGSWIAALVRALTFIDGVPQLIVPDIARALIADPDRYEPRASLTVRTSRITTTRPCCLLGRADRRTKQKLKWPSRWWTAGSSLVYAIIASKHSKRSMARSAICSTRSTPERSDGCQALVEVPMS